MIIIALQGGLGNQMFQYAFASILAKSNSSEVLIDNTFFDLSDSKEGFTIRNFELDIFNDRFIKATEKNLAIFNHLSKVNKIKKSLGLNYPKVYNEPSFDFQENAFSIKSPAYIKGYFQSYKYFIEKEYLIKKIFTFPNSLDTVNKELLSRIKKENTIALHIRRGDYVNDKLTQQFHGNCSVDYYMDSIKYIDSKDKNFTLVFFSDDSEWVKEQFNDLPYSKVFVDNNKGKDSWKDMLLMSSCSHNIIANSSFSWWAAWLNRNPQKIVIAPKNWFATSEYDAKDLIPPEWIRL